MSRFASILCVILLAIPLAAAELPTIAAPTAVKSVHRVHSLADFGDDPELGPWLAKTIGEMIAPGTWDHELAGEKRILRWYAPGKILVVAHTEAVQKEVEAFLQNVKRSLPTPRQVAPPALLRTQHLVPGIPADLPTVDIGKAPKHVFHLSLDGYENKTSDTGEGSETKLRNFTLRYEGDGLVDLAEFAKNVNIKTGAAGTEPPPPIPMPELPPAPKVEEPKSDKKEEKKEEAIPPLPSIEPTKPPETLPSAAPNEEELLPLPMAVRSDIRVEEADRDEIAHGPWFRSLAGGLVRVWPMSGAIPATRIANFGREELLPLPQRVDEAK